MRHYAELPGDKRILVTPNSDHNEGGPQIPDPSMHWVRRHLLRDPDAALPRIRGDRLHMTGRQYTWTTEEASPIVQSSLYWSPGKTVSPARYWVEIPARQEHGQWVAELPETYAGLAGQAFASVFDSKDCAVSSLICEIDGSDPRTEAIFLWPGESLWDVDAGASAWRAYIGSKSKIDNAEEGVAITAGNGKSFGVLTNSVLPASGYAASRKGLRLIVSGNGSAGALKISLARDSNSLDEMVFSVWAHYGMGETILDTPWSDFRLLKTGEERQPWPFDTLLLEGDREDGAPFIVRSIQFIP
jgi:hypothetical protein